LAITEQLCEAARRCLACLVLWHYDEDVCSAPVRPCPLVVARLLIRNEGGQQLLSRLIAFVCALLLSIGGHYERELLGPLKTALLKRIDVNNLQFSLLFSAYSLNSTWTPLLTPFLASKIGFPWTSILATSIILAGQLLVAFSSVVNWEIGILFGMLTFGLGLSPVAVCTEFISKRMFLA
jgi:MFS family permease